MALETYREKRNFDRTPEPEAEVLRPAEPAPTFCVQKHSATRLHYDFRLELDGVLKSWAVPKGPSLNPEDKRMAVLVEDHPLDYASFEGVIPKGEYGAGQVIVWDQGTYSPDEGGRLSFHDRADAEERMRDGLAHGKLSVLLRGQKLKGSFTLVKMARGENEWLLIKHRDESVDRSRDVLDDDLSVLSGLSIQDLKAGRLPDPTRRQARALHPSQLSRAHEAPFPTAVAPMLPTLTEGPFDHPDWLFEPKLDGVRAIALIRDGKVKLHSRLGLDSTAQFPSLAQELARQPERELVLDGEIVATDEAGRPSFQAIAPRLNLSRKEDVRRAEATIPVVYYVFDLLYADGHDLLSVPLEERKALLASLLLPTERVRLVDHFSEDGITAYDAAVAYGLEGLLAKRRGSPYEAGRRSHAWLKVKATKSDDFVIGGYSAGQGARSSTFGALLVGSYTENGQLQYVTNVGTGFDDRTLAEMRRRLDGIRSETCPFAQLPPVKGATWVRPELVAEVKFAERTHDGALRAPVFLRLREDKSATQALRAEVVPPPPNGRAERPDRVAGLASEIDSVLEQLKSQRDRFTLDVARHKIPLTNLDKELWPAYGKQRALTKRDLLVYLAKMAPAYLRHLRDRPLSLIRFPDGIHGERFFQKHWEHQLPDFVETVDLYSEHNDADSEYMLCNNLPTLLWFGQVAALELHSWYSRVRPEPDGYHLSSGFTGSEESIDASLLDYPDFIVFDLDPYIYSGREAKGAEPELNRAAFARTCEVAWWLKETLDALSLSAFVKTSGRTGLHIYVPVLRQLDYDVIRNACRTIGQFVLAAHPKDVTMEQRIDKRTGKVFLDYNQNVRGKTLASIYSLRTSPEAAVSMPLRWEELGKIYPPDFTMLTAPDRLKQVGDLWEGILDAKHDLRALLDSVGQRA